MVNTYLPIVKDYLFTTYISVEFLPKENKSEGSQTKCVTKDPHVSNLL